MKILYVGPLWYGGTCLQRMRAMEDLGHEVIPVDTAPVDVRGRERHLFQRLRRRLRSYPDLAGANQQIIHCIKEGTFEVLWLDKALTIAPATLRAVRETNPETVIVGYSPDDMASKHNQSLDFLKCLHLYHLFFTTKSYGVKELEALGAPKVIFIGNAYDPETHRPVHTIEEERVKFGGSVGFIGDYEKERAQSIFYLAQHGVPVRIWGPNWDRKCRFGHPNMKIEGKPLWGDEYAKAICSFDVNLHFLRKINRDLQTQRSIEIPACSGFMLAERTDEHSELFKEGEEAEFFGSDEELLEKIKYYLEHEEDRKRISLAGRGRCLKSGYSNHEIIKEMLKIVGGLH